jgi:hypothetical protein
MRSTIEMAREAGYGDHMAVLHGPALKRFEALVRADEREACAKVCDDLSLSQNSEWEVGTLDCAEAIRARGETNE